MEESKKPVLVLVPGMFSPGIVFDVLREMLERSGWIVIVVNFPMQKNIPRYFENKDECSLNFCDKVEYLLGILKQIDGRYSLVGHSAGAVVALKAAAMDDVNPENVYLIAPAGPYGIFHLYPSVVKSFWCVMRDPYFMTKSIIMPYENVRWAMLNTLMEDEAKRIYNQLQAESGKFIFEVGFWFLDSKRSTFVDYRKILCPIKIFVGTEDRVTPLKVSRGIVRRINLIDQVEKHYGRDIQLIELKDLSHWLLSEAGNEIVEYINSF